MSKKMAIPYRKMSLFHYYKTVPQKKCRRTCLVIVWIC